MGLRETNSDPKSCELRVCYGMHNECGESRPVGEVLELPSWIYERHRPPLFSLALYDA